MTVFGKILVIINLVFSLLVGGLIIMVFVARTNWKTGFDAVKKQLDISNANVQVYAEAEQKAVKDGKDEAARLQKSLEAVQGELEKEHKERKAIEDENLALKGTAKTGDANTIAAKSELEKRRNEVAALEKQIEDLNKQAKTLVEEQAKLRDQAVAATIERDSVVVRNKLLLEKTEDLAKQLAQAKASGGGTGGGTGATTASRRNPPSDTVEGLIKKTDASGLVTITIGSDAGLKAGNTLEIYRLGDNPRYLGTLYIVETRANEAVGRRVSGTGTLQVGDRVSSKILGS